MTEKRHSLPTLIRSDIRAKAEWLYAEDITTIRAYRLPVTISQ